MKNKEQIKINDFDLNDSENNSDILHEIAEAAKKHNIIRVCNEKELTNTQTLTAIKRFGSLIS